MGVYRNITIELGELYYQKSIAFVVNAGMNLTANNLYIKIKERIVFFLKYLLCSTEVVLDI